MEVVAKSIKAVPARKSGTDPATGMARSPWMIKGIEKAEAMTTTSPMLQTLLTMISKGVTGITSRCSIVPCSRSRIRAAPVSTIESMVI